MNSNFARIAIGFAAGLSVGWSIRVPVGTDKSIANAQFAALYKAKLAPILGRFSAISRLHRLSTVSEEESSLKLRLSGFCIPVRGLAVANVDIVSPTSGFYSCTLKTLDEQDSLNYLLDEEGLIWLVEIFCQFTALRVDLERELGKAGYSVCHPRPGHPEYHFNPDKNAFFQLMLVISADFRMIQLSIGITQSGRAEKPGEILVLVTCKFGGGVIFSATKNPEADDKRLQLRKVLELMESRPTGTADELFEVLSGSIKLLAIGTCEPSGQASDGN